MVRHERVADDASRHHPGSGSTVALASLSYHVVEKPIRYGTLGAHLSRRRAVYRAARHASQSASR